jgi:hypothetical protein
MSYVNRPTITLSPTSDSGISDSDHYTNTREVLLTGTGDPGAHLSVTDTPYTIGTTVVKADGTWEMQATLHGNNATHQLTVFMFTGTGSLLEADPNEDLAQSKTLVIHYNNTAATPAAPQIDQGAVAPGATYYTSSTGLTFVGELDDGESVALYDGDIKVGEFSHRLDMTGWTITVNELSDGIHKLTTVVTDRAGNVSAHSPAQVVDINSSGQLDLSTVGISAASDTGIHNDDGITKLASPVFHVTGANLASITLRVDGVEDPHPQQSYSNGVWSVSPKALTDGQHLVEVIGHDLYGNSSPPWTNYIIVDTQMAAPTLELSPESDGGMAGGVHLIEGQSASFTGTAEAGALVELTIISTATSRPVSITRMEADADGHWWLGDYLNDGNYSVAIKVTDAAGNSATVQPIDVRVASGAPALSTASNSGSVGDQVTNNAKPSFTGHTSAQAKVALYDGETLIGNGVADAKGNWTVTPAAKMADGEHAILAYVTESAGNTLPASGVLILTIDTGNTTAPVAPALDAASDSGASNGDLLTSVNTPTIHGTASRDALVTLFVDGKATPVTTHADDQGEWSLAAGKLADGAHKLTVSVTNVAGTVSPQSAPLTVTIDTKAAVAAAAPTLDAASDNGTSSTDHITSITTPHLAGKAEAGAAVDLFDGVTKIGSAVANASGVWSITSGALAEGLHQLTTIATDAAGNRSAASAALSLTISTATSAPTNLSLDAASDKGQWDDDNVTNVATPTVTGKAAAGATVTLFDGDLQVGKAVANAAGVWSATSAKLADGDHHLTAKAVDPAGNASVVSAELKITIDTKAPAPATDLRLEAIDDSGVSHSDGLTNDQMVRVSLVAENLAYVNIYDNGVLANGGTWSSQDGRWYQGNGLPLADGVHNMTFKVTDLAGNVSVSSQAVTITVDTKAPIMAAPDLVAASDTGASSTDDLTSQTKPVLTGKTEANIAVSLYEGATLLGSTVSDANGNWQIAPEAALADGVHSLTVKGTDRAGNTSAASPPLKITVDTTASSAAPSALDLAAASDKGGSSTDDVTNLATPTITGKAEAGATVALFDGETKIGTAVATAAGVWTIASAKLADGAHHLTASSVDQAGNLSAPSAELLVTVDTKAPVVAAAPVLDALSDSGTSSADRITNVTTPKVGGTTEAGATVALFDGATQVGTAVADADGVWSITSKALAAGAHSLTVKVSDVAGNVSAASPALALTVDTAAPVAPTTLDLLAAADSGASATDNITGVDKPVVSGKADANASVSLYDGATLLGTVVADSKGAWQIAAPTALEDGVHSLTAKATDVAGNTSVVSAALKVTIDTTASADAPTALDLVAASDKGASSTDNLTSLATPSISGKAAAGATVILLDGATKVGTAVANAAGTWTIVSAKLADGVHHLSASSVDLAGNVSTASDALTVTVDTTATVAATAPLLDAASDSGKSNADHITNIATPHVTGTTEAGASVALFDGVTLVGSAVADADGAWSIMSKALTAGAHSLTVKVTDLAGNVSAASPALALTVDTVAAVAPTTLDLLAGADSGTSATDNVTSVNKPIVSGKAEANASVSLYDGATLLGTVVADSKGAWQIAASDALADGVHNLTAKATDAAGNTSVASAALKVTIDTTVSTDAPTALDLVAASDKGGSSTDNLTSLATPSISGKAAAGATVVLFDGATQVGKAVATAAGAWTIVSAKLADGVHHLTAGSVDLAGNVSPLSNELTVTIDSGAPVVGAPVLDALSDSGRSSADHITNVVAPHLTGTAEAGATVTLYDGAAQLGSAVANEDGAWSITAKALAAGVHNLTAKATDLAGNVSAASPALAVTIDNKAPVAPTTLDLLASADSGASAADNLTAISTPVLSGKAEAFAGVSLYDGATLLGSGVADSLGNWKIASTVSLSSGAHNLTATATDIAGNTSAAPAALKVTIDAAATGLTLAGTAALDHFLLNEQAGAIRVLNFSSAGGDQLVLSHAFNGLTLDTAADVLAHSHLVGKDTVIDLGAGHAVTLVGVAALAAHDVAFIS